MIDRKAMLNESKPLYTFRFTLNDTFDFGTNHDMYDTFDVLNRSLRIKVNEVSHTGPVRELVVQPGDVVEWSVCEGIVLDRAVEYLFPDSLDSITALPPLITNNKTGITDFSRLFSDKSLTSIPSDLLANNPQVQIVNDMFYRTPVQTIGEGLFSSLSNLVSADGCFSYCKALSAIPERLFANNTKLETVEYCFSSTKVSNIPPRVLTNNSNIKSVRGLFAGCASITSIPEGLLDSLTVCTNFESCFSGCCVTSIPENLLVNCAEAENLESMFSFDDCSLTEIPVNIIATNKKVTNIKHLFRSSIRTPYTANLVIGSPFINDATDFVDSDVAVRVTVAKGSLTEQSTREFCENWETDYEILYL